jgi:competence protein ComEC
MVSGIEISFLNPSARKPSQRENQNPSILNNHSLVMKLCFKNISILLTGDIEQEAEYRMMEEGAPLKAHVLKIPHHGSNSSSTFPFIERVKPVYAVVSVGERNIAKLPHPEVLKRYRQLNTRIFRTDKQGAITVITDGEKVEVIPFVVNQN